MLSRKEFLRQSMLTALAGSFGIKAFGKTRLSKNKNIYSIAGSPLVIATWDNRKATETAMEQITNGKTALDAVEAGARIPEADPEDTSVGFGGMPDRDGRVTLDASIIDEKGNAGAVTFLQHIMHPVSVARMVMEKTPHVMLSGDGALQFALANGFIKENLLTDKSKTAWKEWIKSNNYTPVIDEHNHDTIGILAIDNSDKISGACTTSGWAFKMHGRVGDSPIPGAGMYVDNEVGGACATGTGELVIKICGSFLITELMRNGRAPQEATEEAIHRMMKKIDVQDKQVGFLAINKNGEHGAFAIREGFTYALFQNGENKKLESDFFIR